MRKLKYLAATILASLSIGVAVAPAPVYANQLSQSEAVFKSFARSHGCGNGWGWCVSINPASCFAYDGRGRPIGGSPLNGWYHCNDSWVETRPTSWPWQNPFRSQWGSGVVHWGWVTRFEQHNT